MLCAMEPEGSWPFSKQTASSPYTEQDQPWCTFLHLTYLGHILKLLYLCLHLPSSIFPLSIPTTMLYKLFLMSNPYLILHYLIILMIFCLEHISWAPTLYKLLPPPFNLSILGRKVVTAPTCPATSSLHFFLSVGCQVSCLYEVAIIVGFAYTNKFGFGNLSTQNSGIFYKVKLLSCQERNILFLSLFL